jgi:hypothetical protein
MQDDDIRALFHRIDDGPPVRVDVREVMAGGRRARTRRTALAFAGGTAVVALAAVIAIAAGRDVQTPDLNRPANPPTTSSPHVSPPDTPQTTPGGASN